MSDIDEVKQRLDIVDVVAAYLKVDKAGRNFKALCPFHQEKTPSFVVFPERQSWRCFGCGAGGDLFAFVMKKEGIAFGDALKILADRAGISLARRKEVAQDEGTERLYHLNAAAAQYYHYLLLQEAVAEAARDYVKRRGLTPETIAEFQLGFSAGEGLGKHLVGRGYDEEELVAAGLLGAKESRTYDLFRQRLMFPIRDIKGRVVGFGARALDDSSPKYLNTSQTAVFDKGGILYGIDRAAAVIREQKLAVLVEGYMDVITAHQHGITNVVASMGTALTEKQIRMLTGLTKNIALAPDPDIAGNEATLRGLDSVWHAAHPRLLKGHRVQEVNLSIIKMPPGKDPDDLIREDPDGWQNLVHQAIPWAEFIFQAMVANLDLTNPRDKSTAVDRLAPYIAAMPDPIQRSHYAQKLARMVEVDEKTIGTALRIASPDRADEKRQQPSSIIPALASRDPLEEYCLSLLLRYPELRDKAEGLLPDHFGRSENREVFLAWRAASLEELPVAISVDLREHFEALGNRVLPPADYSEVEAALGDCIRRLEERRLRAQEEFLTAEAVSLVSAGDDESLALAKQNILWQETTEVDARLVRGMPGRSGRDLVAEEDE